MWTSGILMWSLNEKHFEKLNELSTTENGYLCVGQTLKTEFLIKKIICLFSYRLVFIFMVKKTQIIFPRDLLN